MIKYRAFIATNIYLPDSDGEQMQTFVIHIPEPVSYDTEQEALDSKIRWDCFFCIKEDDVAILIHRLTTLEADCYEIDPVPEFCYDYDTFVKLGGWIEQINDDHTDKITTDFGFLCNRLLEGLLYAEPTGRIVIECGELPWRIPTPDFLWENPQTSDTFADNSFYEALSVLEPGMLKGRICNIGDGYLSIYASDDDTLEDLIYDVRTQKVMRESEWERFCHGYLTKQQRKRKQALEKHGLLTAYTSLRAYLQSHDHIRQIYAEMTNDGDIRHKLIERDLSYGYKLTGFELMEDSVIWKVTTYERSIKENDYIRAMDTCYLMFRDGVTTEAVIQLEYQWLIGEDVEDSEEYINYMNQYKSLPL